MQVWGRRSRQRGQQVHRPGDHSALLERLASRVPLLRVLGLPRLSMLGVPSSHHSYLVCLSRNVLALLGTVSAMVVGSPSRNE